VTSLATVSATTTTTSSAAQLIIAVPAVNISATPTIDNNNNPRKEEPNQKTKTYDYAVWHGGGSKFHIIPLKKEKYTKQNYKFNQKLGI